MSYSSLNYFNVPKALETLELFLSCHVIFDFALSFKSEVLIAFIGVSKSFPMGDSGLSCFLGVSTKCPYQYVFAPILISESVTPAQSPIFSFILEDKPSVYGMRCGTLDLGIQLLLCIFLV